MIKIAMDLTIVGKKTNREIIIPRREGRRKQSRTIAEKEWITLGLYDLQHRRIRRREEEDDDSKLERKDLIWLRNWFMVEPIIRLNPAMSKDQFVETNKLDHRTRIQLGRSLSWTSQLGERPRLTQHGFSLAVHRAGPKMDSAWPFAELDPARIQLGRRAGPIQFGNRPSWTQDRFSSAVRQVGPVQFDERSSWIDRNPSSPRPHNYSPEIALNSFLFRLDWRHRQNFTI
ncbi:hypothetical protein F2Q70_00004101 [Brassica cretica]|uniref:Uncharacterized protein n=1 Tax=Brassica cretica TaxID=69181 RepID=A0A8S9J409_BRACR|nr:hypothetical protein F2Q70_00004101 [Brassica cretica]